MATRQKKRPSKDPTFENLKADYYPVQRIINIGSAGSVVGQLQYCDVSRMLSVVNHRLYRQGKTYECKVDLAVESGGGAPTQIDVFALRDTWMTQKAWQLARATYEKSMAQERTQVTNGGARWEDFRVSSGVSGVHTMQPFTYDVGSVVGAPDNAGEFFGSQIVLADGTTARTFSWGATTGSSLGILEEYDKSGDTQTDTVPAAGAYAGVEDGSNEASVDALKLRGRNPPYDTTNISARAFVRVASLTRDGTGSQRLSTGMFNAPCGIVIIKTSNPNHTLTEELTLTVKAGKYKGVSAHNMGV